MKVNCIPNKIIIFGGSHVNTLGLIRSLGKLGFPIIVFLEHCDLDMCSLRFSKYISKLYYLDTLEDALDILHREYWNEAEKPIILNASDMSMSLLDSHYNELKDKFFCFNCCQSQGRINQLMNKWRTFPIAVKSGFSIIKTWNLTNSESIPIDMLYPCLIKGNKSITSSKTDMKICKNRVELEQSLSSGGDFLVQEFIEKDYELDIVGFAYNQGHNTFVAGAVNKLRDYIYRQSDYICLRNIDEYPAQVKESISKFIYEIGYEGLFSIELICKDEKFYFLEMNLRNDGTCYLYTAAGVNYPLCWVKYCSRSLTNEYLDGIKLKTPFTLMQMSDIYNVFQGKVSLGKWIVQAIKADTHFTYDIHDMAPFIHSLYVHIRQLVRKVFKLI